MREDVIIAISAGMKSPKKESNYLNKKNLYLNYGLLGLATLLSDKGYKIKMFQGDYESPDEVITRIQKLNIDLFTLKYPVLLSIPSFFAVEWAHDFCKILKHTYNINIVVGGRWVVGKDAQWLKNRIPEVDLVLVGLGEDIIETALYVDKWKSIETNQPIINEKVSCFKKLDFSLLDNFLDYQPCIEVSRGCGRGCSFCMEKSIPLSPMKKPEDVIGEMISTTDIYQSKELNFYFQASFFKPNLEWAIKLKKHYKQAGITAKWRCETRVDNMPSAIIQELSQAGLKIIDLGLESASLKQLISMGKTKSPDQYLQKAGELLRQCKKYNIWVKVNILLYAGETLETLEETLNWLKKNSQYIKGVSVNPQIMYGYDINFESVTNLGASLLDNNSISEKGYGYINLSEDIDFNLSKKLSIDILKKFMTMSDFWDLKSFSYFSRKYSLEKFEEDVLSINEEELPFSI